MNAHAMAHFTRTPQPWQAWLLGDDARRQVWLRRMLAAYSVFWVMHVMRAVALSLSDRSLDALLWPAGFDAAWMLGCFLFVRLGGSRHWHDPALTEAQVVLALVSVMLSFALVDVGRSAALPMLGGTLAFGLYHLSGRQLMGIGVVAVLAMAVCLWVLNLVSASGIDEGRDMLGLLGAALSLPLLAWTAGRAGEFRRRQALQRVALQDALARLAEINTQDALTGLTDHQHMLQLLAAECKRHSRSGRPFCVAMLDIDQLHLVNEAHGRDRGDEVIRDFARLSQTHLRASDVMSRWSGEEFMILMPETDLAGGQRSVERLREFLLTRWGYYHQGRWVPMNCSVGITSYRLAEPLPQMLGRAEQALRNAQTQARQHKVAS